MTFSDLNNFFFRFLSRLLSLASVHMFGDYLKNGPFLKTAKPHLVKNTIVLALKSSPMFFFVVDQIDRSDSNHDDRNIGLGNLFIPSSRITANYSLGEISLWRGEVYNTLHDFYYFKMPLIVLLEFLGPVYKEGG